jgi:putative endopeptidase
MEGLNIEKWKNREWLVDCPRYFKHLFSWICNAPQDQVVALFTLDILMSAAEYLRPSIRLAEFNLNKAFTGVSKQLSESKRFLLDLKGALPDVLCIEYASKEANEGKEKQAHIIDIVERLRESAIEVMRNNTTLTKHTTALTLEKIRRMYFEIGKGRPEKIPKARYYEDSIIHTIISISEARSDNLKLKFGKHINKFTSDYPCYIVNASYYEDTNRIVMPWGILQWPFYSKDAPLGWNYGAIGSVVGHEITHAFDSEGSHYSPRAVYREWWTRKNRNRFKRRTLKVSKFYSKFKHFKSHLDGKQTLDEDWADLGGLKISLNALKIKLDSMGVNPTERKDALRTFFIAYAVSWKESIRRKKLLTSIKQSVHSPAEDRVDRILPQFQEWVDIFDVKKGDKLFIKEEDRLKFF